MTAKDRMPRAGVEFSRTVDTTRLPRDELVQEIAATPAERAALAARFDLVDLARLEARVRLRRLPGGMFRLTADLDADATQTCVVTLEPVAARVTERFTLLFGTVADTGEIELDGDGETVEPLADGTIDLGEAVAQQLSLALDPYPRAPGAAAPAADDDAPDEERPASPFAALERLRKNGQPTE
jgi:uncharacterized metal-binding protein YceD (DUF177 family)